jgi:hypothetical protein
MGTLSKAGLIALAGVMGILASELLCRSTSFRDLVGGVAGRGHLIALVHGKGIYNGDLDSEDELTAADLIMAENLRSAASMETIEPARIEREFGLLRAQFAGETAFLEALRWSGLSVSSLRDRIAEELRSRQWLEKQTAPASVAEREARQFYEARRDRFMEPVRYRASHLFLAAHAETPSEVVQEKERAIAELPARLGRGEPFSQLAAQLSEDGASKLHGGDLGFFSETRVTPEFFAEIQKLRAGQTSKPFRTHLGFHIVQMQETRAARLLSFEEARAEISLALENRTRRSKVDQLRDRLSRATYPN